MADVIMPKMGDAMTEGKVLSWRKQVGEAVAQGEPIAEIETDKVNVDIEAEESGTLLQIVVPAGERAPVGAKIAVIGAPGTPVGPATPAAPAAEAPPAQRREPTARAAGPGVPERPAPADHIKASPLARRLAQEHGIDLSRIGGTGPDGRITKEDVEAVLASRPAPSGPTPPRGPEFADETPTRMRATIARRMTESKQRAPHFYVTTQVLMDEALHARQLVHAAADEGTRVTINDFVVRATALALRTFPNLNSAYLDGKIRRFSGVNIAIAIALPDGLVALTLRECDRKSVLQIGTDARALAERARAGHLRPEDYEGATFTISNLGMYEFVEHFVAIINPPHAAILAVGAARPHPIVHDGELAVATTMALTLSADHRVTDGAEAAQFLGEVKRLLEHPDLLAVEEPKKQ